MTHDTRIILLLAASACVAALAPDAAGEARVNRAYVYAGPLAHVHNDFVLPGHLANVMACAAADPADPDFDGLLVLPESPPTEEPAWREHDLAVKTTGPPDDVTFHTGQEIGALPGPGVLPVLALATLAAPNRRRRRRR